MAVRIAWSTSVRTSELWSVRAFLHSRLGGQRLVDPRLSTALEPLVPEMSALFPLANAIRAVGREAASGAESAGRGDWFELLALSIDDPDVEELARRLAERDGEAFRDAEDASRFGERAADAKPRRARWTECLTAIDESLRRIWPRWESELPLRIGPLREQWEARGPGLIARMARRAGWGPWDWDQPVALVQPAWGGAGACATDAAQTIVLEALLTNADSQLPETLRLAWFIAQRALLAQRFPALEQGPSTLAAVAALPLVLEAGHYVELVSPNPNLLTHAQATWLADLESAPASPLRLAELPDDYSTWLATWLASVA